MKNEVKYFEAEADEQGIMHEVGTKASIGDLMARGGWRLLAVLPGPEPRKAAFIMQAPF
jgi:hypothetical protein